GQSQKGKTDKGFSHSSRPALFIPKYQTPPCPKSYFRFLRLNFALGTGLLSNEPKEVAMITWRRTIAAAALAAFILISLSAWAQARTGWNPAKQCCPDARAAPPPGRIEPPDEFYRKPEATMGSDPEADGPGDQGHPQG